MGRAPSSAQQLRQRCAHWPEAAVRRAVATAIPDPGLAAVVAAWLLDADPPANDPPPLGPRLATALGQALQQQRN